MNSDNALLIDGANVVVLGTFATDPAAVWTYTAAGWAWDTDRMDATPHGTPSVLTPVTRLPISADEVWEVVFTVSNFVAGTVTASIGGTAGTARGSNATFTQQLTAVDGTNLQFALSIDADLSIDTIVVKKVSKDFRITQVPAKLSASQTGVLQSWDGNGFVGSATTIVGTNAISVPGRYLFTLDVAGYASAQE